MAFGNLRHLRLH